MRRKVAGAERPAQERQGGCAGRHRSDA